MSETRTPPSGAMLRAHRLAPGLAVLLLLLAGCASVDSLQTPPESSKDQPAAEKQGNSNGTDESATAQDKKTDDKCLSCQSVTGDKNDENSSKANHSPPKPKTICQAFDAYCHCLHYGPPPAKKEKAKENNNGNDEQGKEGKKNEPAQGDEDKIKGEKRNAAPGKNRQEDKDSGSEPGKEGKKNEPAQGDEAKNKEGKGEKKD